MKVSKKVLKEIILETYINILQEKANIFSEKNDVQPESSEEENSSSSVEPELPDSTDIILSKFPTLKHTLVKLHTDEFKEFIHSVDWISPRPTVFRVNIKNGQQYTLKWTGKGMEATISGKKYFVNSLSDYQLALKKLVDLYQEGPMENIGTEPKPGDLPGDIGGSSGRGNFPGEDTFQGEPEQPSFGDQEGSEESEDLSGEVVDFESPEEEPSED